MNRLPKLVCSRTPQTATWNNTTLVKDNVAGEVARLKLQGSGNLFVFGSADLSRTLMNEGLFDEYHIGIAPVIHGRGMLLFSKGHNPRRLQLLEARSHSTGCVILRYLVAKAARAPFLSAALSCEWTGFATPAKSSRGFVQEIFSKINLKSLFEMCKEKTFSSTSGYTAHLALLNNHLLISARAGVIISPP